MTNDKRLQASRETARRLKRLLQQTGNGIAHLPRLPASASKSVVVQLLADIAADDYDPHDAALLALQEGTFVDSGQRVQVRCISDEIAFANSRVIVEPVGRLGLCFEYCSCQLPFLDITRLVDVVGPQADTLGYSTHNWSPGLVFGRTFGPLYTSYRLVTDFTEDYEYDKDPGAGVQPVWVYRMQPMRYRIRVPVEYAGTPQWKIPREIENRIAWSSTTPPSDSHFGGLSFAGGQLAAPLAIVPNVGGAQLNYASHAKYYRVYVDGVDVSGVQELTQSQHSFTDRRTTGNLIRPANLGAEDSFSLAWPFSIPVVNAAASTITWDVWYELHLAKTSWISAAPAAYTYSSSYNVWDEIIDTTLARFHYVHANRNRDETDTYTLAFADNGPGGAESLTFQTTTGWTYTKTSRTSLMMEHGTSGDIVEFAWNHEHPQIRIFKPAERNQPNAQYDGWMRYFPTGSGDYDALTYPLWGEGQTYEYGIWNTQSSTTFIPQGRRRYYYDPYEWRLKHSAFSSLLTNFPSSITVTKAP